MLVRLKPKRRYKRRTLSFSLFRHMEWAMVDDSCFDRGGEASKKHFDRYGFPEELIGKK